MQSQLFIDPINKEIIGEPKPGLDVLSERYGVNTAAINLLYIAHAATPNDIPINQNANPTATQFVARASVAQQIDRRVVVSPDVTVPIETYRQNVATAFDTPNDVDSSEPTVYVPTEYTNTDDYHELLSQPEVVVGNPMADLGSFEELPSAKRNTRQPVSAPVMTAVTTANLDDLRAAVEESRNQLVDDRLAA